MIGCFVRCHRCDCFESVDIRYAANAHVLLLSKLCFLWLKVMCMLYMYFCEELTRLSARTRSQSVLMARHAVR